MALATRNSMAVTPLAGRSRGGRRPGAVEADVGGALGTGLRSARALDPGDLRQRQEHRPDDRENTPKSKSIADASSNSPITGRWKYPKVLVRNGRPNRSEPSPVSPAARTPTPSMVCALRRRRAAAQA
jgi:hypothetical protein